ncbi:MAG TPA: alcohol dehydrogenase [Firmicutes bacterium]|nr:alcohol dehydrogenase [Bacillota bacterium]
MLAYTYVKQGDFQLLEKPRPALRGPGDAVVRVTLASICTSDLHIKHGFVPRAVPGVTVGHELVGVVEETGAAVTKVKPGDRVAVNVETFCGQCFFCKSGWVNNCTDPNGGWALGCRIDGGQAEFVRVPHADQGLDIIPETVTDRQALFVGDLLSTGYWAAQISEIRAGDTVLIIGAGPTGLCTLQCVQLYRPGKIILCEKDPARRAFARGCCPNAVVTDPEHAAQCVAEHSAHGGADAVIEAAGGEDTFELAWRCARPNAVVTVAAMYDRPQILPLPDMYGKNLIFKTGGVDGCHCDHILELIAEGKLNTETLITHTYPLRDIARAYECFENRADGVFKVAVAP